MGAPLGQGVDRGVQDLSRGLETDGLLCDLFKDEIFVLEVLTTVVAQSSKNIEIWTAHEITGQGQGRALLHDLHSERYDVAEIAAVVLSYDAPGYVWQVFAQTLIMLAHSAQREDAGVFIERIVLEIDGNLIESYPAGSIAKGQHFHDFACGHSGLHSYRGTACGTCHCVLIWINEPTGSIDLEHRHCAGDLRYHRYIQLKIAAVIDELELLIVFGVGHSSLPAQTSRKIGARLIFSRSTVTDGLHCADIVQGIGKRIRVEIVVKHDVAHIGYAEVAQRELQHRI